MLEQNAVILKEWAAVCQALLTGRQTILLRKGGIAEGPQGFAIEHNEFWLLPTYLHQSVTGLTPDAADLFAAAQAAQPPAGRAHISAYAIVDQVWFIDSEQQLPALRPFHVLSDATVTQRFHYRQPGLFVAAVRVLKAAAVFDVEEDATLAGCKSWGELPAPLSTATLTPLHVASAEARLAELRRALTK